MSQNVQIEKENAALQETGLEFFEIRSAIPGECTASAHIHSAIELLYITEGVFSFHIGGKRHIARQGDLVLLYSNTVHSIFLDSAAGTYCVLKLKPSVFLDMVPGKQGLVYLLPFTAGQTYLFPGEQVCALGLDGVFREMLQQLSDRRYASQLILKANALRVCGVLLNTLHRQSPLAPEDISFSSLQRIYEAMLYVNDHFATDVSAKNCADRMAMSYPYFSRMFKRIAGTSFSAYLTQTRIKNAVQQLTLTEKSVTDICFDCGFNDISYFIAQFKASQGVSPAQFRKQNQTKQKTGL